MTAYLARRKRLFWPFPLPALALYVPFLMAPTVATVVLSFTRWVGAGDTPMFTGVAPLMAAVDRIPAYLYEDADIAGASPWQKFRAVTLPLTWDVSVLVVALRRGPAGPEDVGTVGG